MLTLSEKVVINLGTSLKCQLIKVCVSVCVRVCVFTCVAPTKQDVRIKVHLKFASTDTCVLIEMLKFQKHYPQSNSIGITIM